MSGSGLDVIRDAGRLGNGKAVLFQSFDVKPNHITDFAFDILDAGRGSDAAGKIRHVSGVIPVRLFDNDRVTRQRRSFRPACSRILANVLRARSSDGLPAGAAPPLTSPRSARPPRVKNAGEWRGRKTPRGVARGRPPPLTPPPAGGGGGGCAKQWGGGARHALCK